MSGFGKICYLLALNRASWIDGVLGIWDHKDVLYDVARTYFNAEQNKTLYYLNEMRKRKYNGVG